GNDARVEEHLREVALAPHVLEHFEREFLRQELRWIVEHLLFGLEDAEEHPDHGEEHDQGADQQQEVAEGPAAQESPHCARRPCEKTSSRRLSAAMMVKRITEIAAPEPKRDRRNACSRISITSE